MTHVVERDGVMDFLQERFCKREFLRGFCEQPYLSEQVVNVFRQCIFERLVEQSVDTHVPQSVEDIVEVVRLIAQERLKQEENLDVSVAQDQEQNVTHS